MTTKRITRVLVLCAALALTRESRAQGGDLDILSRTVPPVVMIQLDTSSSMRSIILPPAYRTARGNSNPQFWENTGVSVSTGISDPNHPAATVTTGPSPNNFSAGGSSSENYQRTCQIFRSTSVTSTSAVCPPTTSATGCSINDDDVGNAVRSGGFIKCWNVPLGCTNVPSAFPCTTANRTRVRTSGSNPSQPYTVITLPDVSYTSLTLYAPNFLWWMMNEIYKGNAPQFIAQDRLGAAKQAITQLVNNVNIDPNPPNAPRVKFGLSRYHFTSGGGFDDNGGYVVTPADLNNKAALLNDIATMNAGNATDTDYAGTPLSEALVDTARYLAGSDRLPASSNRYPAYNRRTDGSWGDATDPTQVPPTPLTSSCEKVFAIVVTDGLPTGDTNNFWGSSFTSTFGPFNDPDDDSTNERWLDDVARYLYATDIRPSLSGNQNVITYTVGFSLDSPILAAAAAAGHGQYFSTNDADELADSLTGAINDIIQRNTSLTSATVPSLRSAYGNGFYTAYFLPSGRKSVWPGHLEAYTLSQDLVVLDDNNDPAIDPVTKLFYEPRHPHWDARDTLINDYASRTIYTTKGGARVPFTAANLADPFVAAPGTGQLTPTDLALTLLDKSVYPQPATHVSITDPAADPNSLKQLGDSIIDFVHGKDSFDEDGDGDRTDVRPFVFGDVFHSSPVVVGPALTSLRFEPGYGPSTDATSFIGQFGHRERILYVGANDGMLHAFRAGSFVDPTPAAGDEYYDSGNGREVFGYVPGTLLPKIKNLPRDDFGKSYYVDGSPAAADIWLDSNSDGTKQGNEWTTALVTPMREGGESLLALDITDPTATSGSHGPYPKLMWEFTDADLGQTWSRPIITRVKMRGGFSTGDKCGANDGDGDCVETWVAIFGAGYSPEANPNMTTYISDPNAAGYAKSRGVFMVRMSDGQVIAHLKPDASATFSKMKYAMPAEPAVIDYDADGFADLVYIGDLGGQLWKWDISAVGVPVSGMVPATVWPAGVLFEAPVATVAGGVKHYHSIFQSAGVALINHQLAISFASGERTDLGYQGQADPSDPNSVVGLYDDNNRLWVLFDKTPTGPGSLPANLPIYEEPPLLPGHDVLTDITNTAFDGNPNDAGYFFRVPDGHKFITDQLIFSGIVVTLSYLPDAAGAGVGSSCALGGTTFEFAWNMANGTGVLTSSGGAGDPPAGTAVRSQPLGNGAPTNPRITVSITDTGDVLVKGIAQTSSGEVGSPKGLPPGLDIMKSVYWRQEF